MHYLYSFAIFLYGLGIYSASFFSDKARKWVEGRKGYFYKNDFSCFEKGRWVWFHCASLGEFEQGKPIMEKLKQETDYKLFLTFFSPSGYQIGKNYRLADDVRYLPLDSEGNARKLIRMVKPEKAVFIKYEFWYHHLRVLHQENIPIYLISATFHRRQPFFRPFIGKWFRGMLDYYTFIFTNDKDSESLLRKYGVEKVKTIGDSRADRVLTIKGTDYENPKINEFKGDKELLILGSSWSKGENIILNWYKGSKDSLRLLIAPHDVDDGNVERLENDIRSIDEKLIVSRYSDDRLKNDAQILIIDTIGILSKIYRYADWVYVGGGFGKGIHNVLEAAVYGVPVIFGPNHEKFPESVGLINENAAFAINNQSDWNAIANRLHQNTRFRLDVGRKASKVVHDLAGATDTIFEYLIP